MTTQPETLDLAELRRLAEQATPGPWFAPGRPWFTWPVQVYAGAEDPHAGRFVADMAPDGDILGVDNALTNAAYIVALVNAAPALLARIEALETALKVLEIETGLDWPHGSTAETVQMWHLTALRALQRMDSPR